MEKFELRDGDWLIHLTDGNTVLMHAALFHRPISARGRFTKWHHNEWSRFVERVRRLISHEPGLPDELEGLERRLRRRNIEEEIFVIDDDSGRIPRFYGLHSLKLSHSRSNDYIRLWGSTYKHKKYLRTHHQMKWDPDLEVWETGFDERSLNLLRRYLRQHDQKSDPLRHGNRERCWVCKQWRLRDEMEREEDGSWYCGCLDGGRLNLLYVNSSGFKPS